MSDLFTLGAIVLVKLGCYQHVCIQGESEGAGTGYVKKGLTNLLGGITRVLTIPPEDDTEDDMLRVTSTGGLELFDRAKVSLMCSLLNWDKISTDIPVILKSLYMY